MGHPWTKRIPEKQAVTQHELDLRLQQIEALKDYRETALAPYLSGMRGIAPGVRDKLAEDNK